MENSRGSWEGRNSPRLHLGIPEWLKYTCRLGSGVQILTVCQQEPTRTAPEAVVNPYVPPLPPSASGSTTSLAPGDQKLLGFLLSSFTIHYAYIKYLALIKYFHTYCLISSPLVSDEEVEAQKIMCSRPLI